MYTSHGQHIPFTFLEEGDPPSREDCGGPHMCPICTLEALPYLPAFDSLRRSMIIEHARELQQKVELVPQVSKEESWQSS